MFDDLLPREWLIAIAAIGGMLLVVLTVAFVSARWSERREARESRQLVVPPRGLTVPRQRRELSPAELRRLNELYESGSISQYEYARLRGALNAGQDPAAG
jgi:hypothetical protein